MEYYNTLTAGTHYFDIEFMSVSGVKLKIDIPVRDRAGDVAQMSYYWYDGGRVGEVCYIDNGYMANKLLLFQVTGNNFSITF